MSGYAGWQPADSAAGVPELTELPPADVFFREYVARRRPCVLRQCAVSGAAFGQWTDEHLQAQAGDVLVDVEVREDAAQRFGRGRKVRMPLRRLLERIAGGDTSLYMTTQDPPVGADGRPALLGPPLAELAADFPLRPDLLSMLVPAAYNLWIGSHPARKDKTGAAFDGASSGLHHDYHDNLYVLLRGQKQFSLFSPAEAANLHTRGTIATVHPNGRICYEGNETRADGASPDSLEEYARRSAAEEAVQEAERAVAAGEEGAEERLAAAEDELEEILLGALMAGADADEEEVGGEDEEGEEEEEEEKENAGSSAPPLASAEAEGRLRDVPAPDSFSRIDTSRPEGELDAEFPGFQVARARRLVCELREGDMLYLPASWFHEVRSANSPGRHGHMSFNYWFHPPTTADAAAPYPDGFWEAEYQARLVTTSELEDDGEDGFEDEFEEGDEGEEEDEEDEEEDEGDEDDEDEDPQPKRARKSGK